jgi:hypothetical protein
MRILCTRKEITGALQTKITHIGGVNNTGDKWNLSVKDAIEGIISGQLDFYIIENFEEIAVKISGELEKSLFATGQGYLHNLLQDLPDCP